MEAQMTLSSQGNTELKVQYWKYHNTWLQIKPVWYYHKTDTQANGTEQKAQT
jgi:hypothetical protein